VDIKTIASFVGAFAAVAFGVALIWFPPAALAGQPGTYGAAFSFVTGGLGAVGVAVTVPALRESARREGIREGTAIRRASRAKPKPSE
jgi:hypothetical protein